MSDNETLEQKWQRLSSEVGKTYDADVILYSGDIEDFTVDNLIRIAKRSDRSKNVVLMLATRGGSPDAAYRMARCLQLQYEKFVIYIYGTCKSAGTIVAIGAHEIILSDFGEFGPLDVCPSGHGGSANRATEPGIEPRAASLRLCLYSPG